MLILLFQVLKFREISLLLPNTLTKTLPFHYTLTSTFPPLLYSYLKKNSNTPTYYQDRGPTLVSTLIIILQCAVIYYFRHSPTYFRLFASFHNIVFEAVLLACWSGAKGTGRVCGIRAKVSLENRGLVFTFLRSKWHLFDEINLFPPQYSK